MIAINCHDTQSDIKFFYEKLLFNYPMCYNGGVFSEGLGVYAHPIAFLVDKENTIIHVFEGIDSKKVTGKISDVLSRL